VKKYSNLLSVLLVPAMILQAGNTCTSGSGGSGSTAPTLTLPGSVKGIETYTPTSFNFVVTTGAASGLLAQGTSYPGVWCTNSFGVEPGGGLNPNGSTTQPVAIDPSNPTGIATYTPVNSYTISGAGNASYGEPGFTYDATIPGFTTTSLTLAAEWSAVNWILNNPGFLGHPVATADEQAAIWQLLHPDYDYGYIVAPGTTSDAAALYQAALTNSVNYFPGAGGVVAVLMVPTTPSGSPTYQGFIIPIPITCTATGSATLTKTVNVGSAGANAFQLVTYTYTIKNTGMTTLQNLVIVDDNGTPGYAGDDVTITIPSTITLTPGASYSVTSTVYLPISLFYQSGTEAAFDTLIPQVIPGTSGGMSSLELTYLIDSDVSDNTYGTGASAGWAGNGGHTFAELEAGYAQFGLYNAHGTLISTVVANYLKGGASTTSGYGANDTASFGGSYIGVDSTLADNLNLYPVAGDTVNSPKAGAANWETNSAYKVVVNSGIFGMTGLSNFGSAVVQKDYLAATETGYSGKCGSARSATYTPCVYGAIVNSTAYLTAQVCGCATVVHAKACLSVKLCGATQPTCNNPGGHQCQNPVHCSCTCAKCQAGEHGDCTASHKCTAPVCACTCDQCKKGNHNLCTHVGCTDPTCHANNCNHNTQICSINGQRTVRCW